MYYRISRLTNSNTTGIRFYIRNSMGKGLYVKCSTLFALFPIRKWKWKWKKSYQCHVNTRFYRQVGWWAFSPRFWPKINFKTKQHWSSFQAPFPKFHKQLQAEIKVVIAYKNCYTKGKMGFESHRNTKKRICFLKILHSTSKKLIKRMKMSDENNWWKISIYSVLESWCIHMHKISSSWKNKQAESGPARQWKKEVRK